MAKQGLVPVTEEAKERTRPQAQGNLTLPETEPQHWAAVEASPMEATPQALPRKEQSWREAPSLQAAMPQRRAEGQVLGTF